MRKIIMALSALSVALPAAVTLPAGKAEARRHYTRHYYSGLGRRKVCRHSSGTTGLVAGGVAGALAGPAILGHGALATIAGGVGGALGGRAIDRTITAPRRCYYR